MSFFNIHYLAPNGEKRIDRSVHATSKEELRELFSQSTHFDGSKYFDCTFIKMIELNRVSTPKQKLAQKYGYTIGSIKGAKKQVIQNKTELILAAGTSAMKMERAINLVEMQFSKLLRDISDMYKLAGLKVK